MLRTVSLCYSRACATNPAAFAFASGLPSSRALCSAGEETPSPYEYLKVERRDDGVALVQLHRPRALNALCDGLIAELGGVLDEFEQDDAVGAVVLTGSKKAFAAGADIAEMSSREYPRDTYSRDMFARWERVSAFRKPIIAAVNGFALGGGCELAMMCDVILAGNAAKFAQPEIKLGTIPGVGGTQRLTRAVGKSKAMELTLSGNMMGAEEALQFNLVSRVVPADELVHEATELAAVMASYSRPVAIMAKEAVNQAYESSLKEGVHFERRLFHSTFALEDQKIGMNAFLTKSKPEWKNQ